MSKLSEEKRVEEKGKCVQTTKLCKMCKACSRNKIKGNKSVYK
ncbi:hypothetical protein [Bacillus multifaciens]|nr:hypothetical protein [Bacillus sp. WLY-B-L8]MDP7980327.1 hypothetical protein [Bacillus sp. WLY-B-L8]